MPFSVAANDKHLWITHCTMNDNIPIDDAALKSIIKGLIFQLSALHDYGYSQT